MTAEERRRELPLSDWQCALSGETNIVQSLLHPDTVWRCKNPFRDSGDAKCGADTPSRPP